MKKYVLGILLLSQVSAVIAQNNTANTLQSVINKTVLSNSDISNGLKEALTIGATKATGQLAVLIGLGYLVDSVVLSMNRAAENACVKVAPVFIGAIKQMSFQEAVGILKGSDNAATEYLKVKSTDSLKLLIEPIIGNSLKQTKTIELWNTVFKTYNRIPFVQKVNPNLSMYVTEKTMQAVFLKMALEEKKIRTNSAAQTSTILKSVFGTK
jgi:hypothetical protein